MSTPLNIVSTLATITSCSIQIPLIVQIHRVKHADNISYLYIMANFLCAISWLSYGILINSNTLIIADSLYLFMFMIVMGQKIYFNGLGSDMVENGENNP